VIAERETLPPSTRCAVTSLRQRVDRHRRRPGQRLRAQVAPRRIDDERELGLVEAHPAAELLRRRRQRYEVAAAIRGHFAARELGVAERRFDAEAAVGARGDDDVERRAERFQRHAVFGIAGAATQRHAALALAAVDDERREQ
jgi:hypothetical protein